jgi:hypothetical protein
MDVLSDQLIDIGLNILGYLIAGALGMLIYSTFHRKSEAPAVTPVTPAPITEKPAAESAEGKRSLEFVTFRKPDKAETAEVTAPAESKPQVDRNKRSDRAEVIRLARGMIKAGASGETIRRTLPISEGELALLQIGKP